MKNYFWMFFLTVLLLTTTSQAKIFRNAYISFETPESWNCILEQTEWVCRSSVSKEAKEAIIILTAKEVGPTDSFALYEQHLNNPITINLRSGGSALSKVVYKTKNMNINNQPWLDGLHLGSEVPNYYTRYLATIKERISVLVTFSAHKDFYTKYNQDFFKAIMSLKVIASSSLLAKPDLSVVRPSSGELGSGIGAAMPIEMYQDPSQTSPQGKKNKKMLIFIGAILLAAIGLFLIFKNRK